MNLKFLFAIASADWAVERAVMPRTIERIKAIFTGRPDPKKKKANIDEETIIKVIIAWIAVIEKNFLGSVFTSFISNCIPYKYPTHASQNLRKGWILLIVSGSRIFKKLPPRNNPIRIYSIPVINIFLTPWPNCFLRKVILDPISAVPAIIAIAIRNFILIIYLIDEK